MFENEFIRIERHESEIPWIKIFAVKPYTELTQCDPETKTWIFRAMEIGERLMLEYFKPDKINIASFGNYVPHLHVHLMARFRDDSFFPEPMWGQKQREGSISVPDFEPFAQLLAKKLEIAEITG